MKRAFSYLVLALLLFISNWSMSVAAESPIQLRGYYMTFMRMPTFGLEEWKETIDRMKDDGANTLILWTAGGFASKKYPMTWEYNRDHKNIQVDFVPQLIDYAHLHKIKVLLGFTPFAYDGINQYPLTHPELKATQSNGQAAQFWGMHSWGFNMCPAKQESQHFMLEYVREMIFDFYPKADGLFIESSDYAICHCAECQSKFFDHEFRFVRTISDDLWLKKPEATVVVYPHYFNGRKIPGFDVSGAKQTFDTRWTLFFTPHSAHIDTNLVKVARSSILWNEGLSRGTWTNVRDGVRLASQNGISGFIPSLEPFSCIDGPPGSGKKRMKPFHFEWLKDGQMPLDELLLRVSRIAYREYVQNPNLEDSDFKRTLAKEIFGDTSDKTAVTDLLTLHEIYFKEADWFRPAPLLDPASLHAKAKSENWPESRLEQYRQQVNQVRTIAERYRGTENPNKKYLHEIASLLVSKWNQAGN